MEPGRLARKLKNARVANKLSLRDVEWLCGKELSNTHLSLLERGIEKHPSPRKLKLLSKVLKLNFLELMILADYITIKDLNGRV